MSCSVKIIPNIFVLSLYSCTICILLMAYSREKLKQVMKVITSNTVQFRILKDYISHILIMIEPISYSLWWQKKDLTDDCYFAGFVCT